MTNPSRAATTECADVGSCGGSRTGTPPAACTESAYNVGSRSAGWSQTPQRACSRYVDSPMTGLTAA